MAADAWRGLRLWRYHDGPICAGDTFIDTPQHQPARQPTRLAEALLQLRLDFSETSSWLGLLAAIAFVIFVGTLALPVGPFSIVYGRATAFQWLDRGVSYVVVQLPDRSTPAAITRDQACRIGDRVKLSRVQRLWGAATTFTVLRCTPGAI